MRFLILILTLILIRPAFADLQAVVQPGYTFGANERPSTSTLNRLGNPTITITGTIGGTNAGIAANSVNGAMLVDGLPGTNLTWDGSSPRKLVILNSGVGSNQVDSAIAGFALTGGGGAYFKVNIDSNSIISTADGDGLRVSTNLAPANLAWVTNTFVAATPFGTNANVPLPAGWFITSSNSLIAANGFVSGESNLVAGSVFNMPHNLSVKPTLVRFVLVCVTNEANGYVVGDELEIAMVYGTDGSSQFAGGANATNVFLVARDTGFGDMGTFNKTNGVASPVTAANWRAKVYARP